MTVEQRIADPPKAAGPSMNGSQPLDGFAHVDAAAVLAGDLRPPKPDFLRRVDGEHLLYRGKLHWVMGEPEHGKTWLALMAAAERLAAGGIVVYIDFEDSAESIFHKLLILNPGLRDAIAERFRYIQPPGAMDRHVLEFLEHDEFAGADLVVIDACTEAMTLENLNPDINAEVAHWLVGLPAAATRSGAAVVVIDHVVKDSDGRGRWAIGAQHKLAHVPVAYSVHCTEPFAPGAVGRATITISKDRPGGVRTFALGRKVAAQLVIDATVPNCLGAALFVPSVWAGPTRKMEELLDLAKKNPEPRTKSSLATLGGDTKAAREAVERMVANRLLVQDGSFKGWPTYVPAAVPGDDGGPVVGPVEDRLDNPSTPPRDGRSPGGTVPDRSSRRGSGAVVDKSSKTGWSPERRAKYKATMAAKRAAR